MPAATRLLVFALQIAEEAEAGDGPLPLPTTTKIHNNYAILLMELGRPRQAGDSSVTPLHHAAPSPAACLLADLPIVCVLADLPIVCLLADLSAGGHSIALGTGLATQGCLLSAEVLASLYF